ncbi:hypothetical protein QAA18_05000 [Luteimonas sp. 8-5]|uniref:hypothetical protein n=1 Tax=Luteimonas sp. 8-5 TaxID=3039387 RepID=UPI002436AB32|nr:hypothetical protein [Luteimonas sp. 8-5]MDG6348099.1 hypothetical protein [Luteimonas sp. 8-5]
MECLIEPKSITVLCTYQCTAACKQCCFESSPAIKGGLEGEVIRARISEAKNEFRELGLVVFSGGEAFLLKEELTRSVAHATALGLKTRIVSNGSWAKRLERAIRVCAELKEAGLGELNLSTGRDHQEFVPEDSIINAAEAAIGSGIEVLVTVETDTSESDCYLSLRGNARIKRLLDDRRFRIVNNFWMPFHDDAPVRRQEADIALLRKGCSQVFENVVLTPHDNLSACCGLTLEHIPEMRLGKNDGSNMGSLYRAQADDFMKYWIRMDGPYSIIEKVMGDAAGTYLEGVVHGCQACAILHKTPEIREKIVALFPSYVEEVMTRFAIKQAVDGIQASNAREMSK